MTFLQITSVSIQEKSDFFRVEFFINPNPYTQAKMQMHCTGHNVILTNKNDQYKTIAIFAKLARGYMTRFIIENTIETIEGLKSFAVEGYGYDANLSTDTKLVFTR